MRRVLFVLALFGCSIGQAAMRTDYLNVTASATVTGQLKASTTTITSLSPGVLHIVAISSNAFTGLVSLSTEVTGSLPESSLSFTDITTNDVSTSKHGFIPKLPNDKYQVLSGTGAYVRSMRSLFDNVGTVGNSGTSETDLHTNTIAANTLTTNGDAIMGEYNLNTNSGTTDGKRVRMYWAGTLFYDSGATTGMNSQIIYFKVLVTRTASSTAIVFAQCTTATIVTGWQYAGIGSISTTFSNTNILKITGTDTGVGAGDNQIIIYASKGLFAPAAQ